MHWCLPLILITLYTVPQNIKASVILSRKAQTAFIFKKKKLYFWTKLLVTTPLQLLNLFDNCQRDTIYKRTLVKSVAKVPSRAVLSDITFSR